MEEKVGFKKVFTITLYVYLSCLIMSIVIGGVVYWCLLPSAPVFDSNQNVYEQARQDSIAAMEAALAAEEAAQAQASLDSIAEYERGKKHGKN